MCHLPRNAVRYPAAFMGRLNVSRRWLARLRASLSMIPCRLGNWPVSKVARLGEHRGPAWNELTNRAPSAASRSMLGVSRYGWPPASNRRSAVVDQHDDDIRTLDARSAALPVNRGSARRARRARR